MTAQACDSIIYEGETLPIHSDPLFDYFAEKGITPNFVPPHTACWRGYVASWEISTNKLYLIGLEGYTEKEVVGLNYLFPRRKKVHAKWFTGELLIEKGEMYQYQHMGYESRYEQEVIVTIEQGNVKDVQTIINRRCAACNESLIDRPVIVVEISPGTTKEHCYHCAKEVVSRLDEEGQKKANEQYLKALDTWEKAAEEFELRRKFNNVNKVILIFGALALFIMALQTNSRLILINIIPALVIVFYALFHNDSDGNKKNPETLPSKPTRKITKTNHHPAKKLDEDDNDEKVYCSGFNPQEIIQRDGRKCQWCGQMSPQVKLEVHHIIPISQGGDDNVRNLITLCVECHKKENWYRHVHKYAHT